MSQVLLITGSTRGIGRSLAEYYASRGLQVVGCARTAATFESPFYQHIQADVSKENDVKLLMTQIQKKYGRLDILINNAAVNCALTPVLMTPFAGTLKTLETNFLGIFLTCREAAKLMMKNSFGRILNMSSMAVKHEVPGEAVYTASKAALTAFSRVFAKEIHSFGITCNVVAPSAIATSLSAAVDQKLLAQVLERNAIKTFGDLSDITNTIDWLIRPESHAITGQVIYLGGA